MCEKSRPYALDQFNLDIHQDRNAHLIAILPQMTESVSTGWEQPVSAIIFHQQLHRAGYYRRNHSLQIKMQICLSAVGQKLYLWPASRKKCYD